MGLLKRFGAGLRRVRKNKGLTQEDFSVVSSRTYLSSLERGLKSPTISKLEELAEVLDIHPLSLLALAYLPADPDNGKPCAKKFAKIFGPKRHNPTLPLVATARIRHPTMPKLRTGRWDSIDDR